MIKPVNLPKRSRSVAICDPKTGLPTDEVVRWLNDNNGAIQYTLNAILQLPEIQAAIANLDAATQAAQTAAANAQTAANNAQSAADMTTSTTSLANSYPQGATLTASDAGTSATVSVTSHTRVYGNGSSVPVNAGSVTGLAYATLYYLYYDDPTRAGGAVTYATTTTPPAQTGNRHVVGSAMTPAAGGVTAPGKLVFPPGSGAIP